MRGEVVYLYAFDVANEIVTAEVKDILASKPFAFEIRTGHTLPKDVPLYRPLAIEPPALTSPLGGQTVRTLVRVYEVGVVSITMRVSIEVEHLTALVPFHRAVLDDGRALDQVARELCEAVCRSIADAMVRHAQPPGPEAYTVFCLEEVAPPGDVPAWLAANRAAVAELLTEARPGTLSETQVAEVLRISRSYLTTDVVVIDWDAALVVDLDGYVDDVLYVLELANLQLEEYRTMDLRLDRYLDRAYEDLKRLRVGVFGTHSATLGTLREIRIDLTKLNDEVTHIGKFFGDWYLARVYLGARERFYLHEWRASVENRLAQLDQLYSVVNTDINNRRMTWLELLIVIFFAIDLLMLAFWRH
ncbi:MAG: hypothetical protein AB7O59_22455 [Pirellulales bacterium]